MTTNIEELLDAFCEQRCPHLKHMATIQEEDGRIIFFDENGLPRATLIIKGISRNIFGSSNVVVDFFDYDKKLDKGNV